MYIWLRISAQAHRLNNCDQVSISSQRIVVGQQNHRLESRLRDEEPIERVLVNRRKFFDLGCMAAHDRQMIEARWFHSRQDFIWGGFECLRCLFKR